MFSYQPMSDEELQTSTKLLKEGEYKFKVLSANAETSKAGNPMIKLTLQILNNDYKVIATLTDFLVANISAAWKLKKFAKAIDEEDRYNQGTFNENHCLNKSGRCFITILNETYLPSGKLLPKRNGINNYISHDAENAPSPLKEKEKEAVDFQDDDLPF